MTQEELAKKWTSMFQGQDWSDENPVDSEFLYTTILNALKEQEEIHPWADAFEKLQKVLDDLQGLALAYDELKEAIEDTRLERVFNDRGD